jgi:hypothetical protein
MLVRISHRLDRWARGWLVLALIVAFVAFEAVTLPMLRRAPGGDIVSLDARFFYTPQEAFSTIGSYAAARPFWIRVYLTWDIVNPVLYTLIFALALSWIFQRAFDAGSQIQRMNLLPLGAGLLDLLENACIVALFAIYPAHADIVAWLATVSTMGKVSLLCLSTLLILLGMIKLAADAIAKRRP